MVKKINQNDRLELYKYRAEIAEAENTAVKSSKAYRVAKILGSIKKDIIKNPVGLTKKAARILLTQPTKILSKGKNIEIVRRGIVEQENKYQEWILLNEPSHEELANQSESSDKFKYRPLISIITPVFNPPVDVLEELIESVLNQTYSNFELCLGDFGTSTEVEVLLKKYASLDSRVKNWKFSENKGIAGNSNMILEKVQGEYIGLLDHDDTLSLDALYENVKALNIKKHDFIYSDKDKIDEKGNRFDPLFKPAFSPEMLLNINYLTHFNIMNTDLVKRVGAWDPQTDGAQDWDLFLKIAADAKSIHHIPKILYHWRVIASSTALSIETKPYALAGQRNSVDKYLAKTGLNGKAVHHKTELFIEWDDNRITQNPIIVVYKTSINHTQRLVRSVLISVPGAQIIVAGGAEKDSVQFGDGAALMVGSRDIDAISTAIVNINSISATPSTPIIFIHDTLKIPKNWYATLTGWLTIDGVGVASGRIIDKHDMIVDSGGVVSGGEYQPIFQDFPRYYQSYIGNAEWVRNLSVVSGMFMATTVSLLEKFAEASVKKTPQEYCEWIRLQNKRIVMTPHVTAVAHSPSYVRDWIKEIAPINFIEDVDPYSNPNIGSSDPMRLFDDESLAGIEESTRTTISEYQKEAIMLAQAYDMSQSQLEDNLKSQSRQYDSNIRSAAFVLPSFDGVYAGLMNIFSFAEYLQEKQGINITFYILKSDKNLNKEREQVEEVIPSLGKASYIPITEQQSDKINDHDLGVATLWSTAYVLAKTNKVMRKCYFIQDNETNFYPKGSISALVDMSYKFNFFALANTKGLLDMYESKYGGVGTVLTSKVDLRNYYPNDSSVVIAKKPYKVFFYARPGMPRNAFELGVAGLKKLKDDMGEDVEIITAGAAWDPATYGVEGYFTNLGKIKYEAVPALYRSLDAGLMFMFSGHPGVTASELMASGCPVVVNEYDDITWNELYVHEDTCLITQPTASAIAHNLKRCLVDIDLRKKLIKNGIAKAKDFYGNYNDQLPVTYEAIVDHFAHNKSTKI